MTTTLVEHDSRAEKDTQGEADASDESSYPEDLCEQFATCRAPANSKEQGVRPVKPLRDDITAPLFIIATVPDPMATHLRVEFDRTMDGIKDAAADEKFLFRRYWFPWPLVPSRQFSDRESQDREDAQRAAKSRLPGLLLFDKAGSDKHQSLIVLLVGESPTDGINRKQFSSAMRLKRKIEELARVGPAYHSDPTYRILGTTFSGSLHTLQLALDEKGSSLVKFEAVSGTVSDRDSIRDFNQHYHDLHHDGPGPLWTLQHDAVNSLKVFQKYLRDSWHYRDQVAVLSETDTAFGALQGLNDSGDQRFVLIPFPRDIAHLRNAYQSYSELSGLGPGNPDLHERKNLPLPLEDMRNTVNSVPDYAAQTVVSQETMVSQIANRLHHEHIRFAAVIGSDVLDVLFITHFMRIATPDTRLCLLDPDLLFVHAADALPFEGVLAVTTFPLLDGNPPFKVTQPDRHWIFPTPFQQGVHNAMRILMFRMGLSQEIVLPGYEVVDQDQPPPLWITSVGRESFVPIAMLPGSSEMQELALINKPRAPAPRIRWRDPSHIWQILFLMVTCAILSLALLFYYAQYSHAAWLNDLRIQGDQAHRQQLSLLLLWAAGIYLLVLSTEVPFLIFHIPFLMISIVGVLSTGALTWTWATRIRLRPRGLLRIALVAASTAAVPVLFFFLSMRRTDYAGHLFQFRSFELSAGTSPTIPFLFLFGGFLGCWFVNLQRHIFHHQRAPVVPRAKGDLILGENVWLLIERLDNNLHEPFRHSRALNVSVAAIAFLLCWLGLHESGTQSFDGIWYDRFFKAWASALVSALAVMCCQFLNVWTLLSKTLEQLETHPVRRALSALPADWSWVPIWQSSPRKRSYLIATRSVDALMALGSTSLLSSERAEIFTNVKDSVAIILRKVAKGERETPDNHLTAEHALARAADSLLEDLQPVWANGSSVILDESTPGKGMDKGRDDEKEKHPDEQPPLVYAFEFIAMRYVAFTRHVMLQLRNMLTFLTVGFLAFAFALLSYPFQGERLIAWVITSVFVALAAAVIFVFLQMEMDPTLNRITNRDAGKLSFEFFRRLLTFGALPLLTVLASNFNGVGRLLFSWIEPALRTLH